VGEARMNFLSGLFRHKTLAKRILGWEQSIVL
jgi:hypothetical protein